MQPIKTLFRWYVGTVSQTEADVLKSQFWNRSNGNSYALPSPLGSLLPFQFFIPASAAVSGDRTVTEWELVEVGNPAKRISLTGQLHLITIFRAAQGIWFTHLGQTLPQAVQTALVGRTWYSVIKLSSNRRVISERFRYACNVAGQEGWLKVEWWNDCDIAGMIYQTGLRNVFYSEYPLEPQEPTLYEEGTENGIRQFVPTLQIQYDQWRLQGLFPDYVYEALQATRLHKNVTAGNIAMKLKDVSGEWEGEQVIVTAKLEGQGRTIVSACCSNVIPLPQANPDSFIVAATAGQVTYASPGSVLSNDTGQGLTVTSVFNVAPGHIVTMNPNGTFSVKGPAAWGHAGGICTFSYNATDVNGVVISASVVFEVSTSI